MLEHNVKRNREFVKSLSLLVVPMMIAPALCCGGTLYLYTVSFDPTAVSAATSVSYLSDGLLTAGGSLYPGQVTVLSSPGSGATLHPGLGAAFVSSTTFDVAFDLGGQLNWLFQADTDSIGGVGTYAFTGSQLSSGLNVYQPGGQVVVRTLASPPVIFRYTESWGATPNSAATSYSYDSPVFLGNAGVIDPAAVSLLSPPGPNAQPFPANFFLVGNNLGSGYFFDANGNSWLMTGALSPFDQPGTYAFTTADVKYFVNNVKQSDTSVEGSLSVAVITPEPGPLGLMGATLLLIGAFVVRAARHTQH
jgi:hypothetical protein